MEIKIKVPQISEDENTPTVKELLNIISQIVEFNNQLSQENQYLRDEIAKIKGGNPKPKIRPSAMDKDLGKKKRTY